MNKHFVAINYIHCIPSFRTRFEELFATRAHAIDSMPGFINMHVLRPEDTESPYLIVSYWETETSFKDWMKSDAFVQGHKRGFAEIAAAKAEGSPAPMKSDFKTYAIISE
ncbi:Heme-degrading monooxygenase HmoA [Chitinophaga costaii]|uniref:Heme-degrading monooxygenase HmoA n=1 Tax=Chitinophaga costaii TaxID=1335309 RepID=A0A1C4EEC7_9BACT|nr:antibiotic biosynthesis monooxygenase [Chitinophaga costaii]PUZ23881.1 antibiotic biosynthesis monooxygenase [Chitinophaga costaii]SCC41925.1 Heme-degrading monooxygenase HmoA [Chitinophaga costaii]